jgi:hypothetical protein
MMFGSFSIFDPPEFKLEIRGLLLDAVNLFPERLKCNDCLFKFLGWYEKRKERYELNGREKSIAN